jgi:hypothetical protein
VEFDFTPSDSPQYTIHDDQLFIVKYPELGPDGEPYKGMFETCFRKKTCSNCKKEKWADEFQWKIKGDEGPFSDLWGRRDCQCKNCESKERKSAYLSKKQKAKYERKRKVVVDLEYVEICECLTNELTPVVAVSDLLRNYVLNLILSPQ